VAVTVPRSRLGELVPHPEDAAFRLIETDSGRFRYLASYANLLLTGDGSFDAPLAEHAKSALTDLVALAIGAGRDATMLAEARGMRAARLHEIRAQIKAGFADPAFSSSLLARRLGISATYLQKLLYETGATFTEHVLELRLQKAQAMLADPRHNGLKVSDIALACGFNEVSYFNRCFRRRFGASPTQCRG
jgi:AraC-like DNA-binding protein